MSVTFYVEDEISDDPELNLSNANARDFLVYLGYTPLTQEDTDLALVSGDVVDPYAGILDPEDVRARCLLAQAVGGALSDGGTDTISYRAEGGATVHDMGRPAGYMVDKATRLLAIAERAVSRGKRVAYC